MGDGEKFLLSPSDILLRFRIQTKESQRQSRQGLPLVIISYMLPRSSDVGGDNVPERVLGRQL